MLIAAPSAMYDSLHSKTEEGEIFCYLDIVILLRTGSCPSLGLLGCNTLVEQLIFSLTLL